MCPVSTGGRGEVHVYAHGLQPHEQKVHVRVLSLQPDENKVVMPAEAGQGGATFCWCCRRRRSLSAWSSRRAPALAARSASSSALCASASAACSVPQGEAQAECQGARGERERLQGSGLEASTASSGRAGGSGAAWSGRSVPDAACPISTG